MQYLDKAGLDALWEKIKGQFQEQSTSLTNILATSGTGFLKKGANDTWTIDTSTYLTEITSALVTNALGYTPINSAKIGVANGLATLDASGKVPLAQISDAVLGQLVYGGTVKANNVATLSTNAKTKLGVTSNTIQLTNDTGTYGYTKCEGLYFIMEVDSAFAALGLKVGDWLIATAAGWKKIANTDAVTGVKGNSETQYRIGNVNITKADIGLGNVENTALSTWSGTNKITTLGTITTGVWQGTAIADSYIASADAWNAKWDYNENTIKAVKVTNAGNADTLGSHAASYFATASGLTAANSNITTLLEYFDGGSAKTAKKLASKVTLWGVDFDGSANVTLAPSLYIGTTKVQTSSAEQNLSGIGTLGVAGVATFSNTTESTSTTTGAVKISGGLGVAKRINVGGDIAAQGGVSAHGITDLSVSGGSGSVSQMRTWDEYEPTSTDQVLGANLGVELHNGKADKVSITAGTAGTSSATSGASIAIPFVTINNQGLVTNYGTHTHTLGSAATKTAGTANGNVPLLGAAASTTANVPAVFNASGALVPHSSGALGSAAFTASTAYLASNHAASGVTTTKISNWDTAYSWGNHASAGYLKSVAYNDLTTKPTSAQIQALVGNYITTFGTKTGAITLRSGSTTRGDVNLSMSNNELRGTVYLADWAKAANKPSYNFSEIGNKPTTISGYGITDAELELTKEDTIVTAFALTLGENVVTVGAIPISEIQALS